MKSAVDSAGRIVIPRDLRERLGLRRGARVEIRERDGHIEIQAPRVAITLVRRTRGPVAVPADQLPTLTDEIVRDALEATRR